MSVLYFSAMFSIMSGNAINVFFFIKKKTVMIAYEVRTLN